VADEHEIGVIGSDAISQPAPEAVR